MKTKAYRHGDVILTRVKSLPKGGTKRDKLILAYSEVTGHCHQITKGAAELVDVRENGELSTYLSVGDDGALLTHEEHGPIALPKGVYRVVIQREYEPDGWKAVMD